MHLYFYLRGKYELIELFKSHAQAAYWKWRRINKKTGKEQTTLVQGALRPSVMGAYEYVFPREALAEVCSFFGITDNQQYGFKRIGLEARHFSLRKIFGAKKIPKTIFEQAKKIPKTFTTEEFERGVSNCEIPGVVLHLIGIKEDKTVEMGDYIQEGL